MTEPATLIEKLVAAIVPKAEAKPFRIAVLQPDGTLLSVPATREEMIAYCSDRSWRRIE